MRYEPDEFLALMDAVASEGGRDVPEPCMGEEIRYKIDGEWKRYHTTGCGMSALFEVPYDPTQPVSKTFDVPDMRGNSTGRSISITHGGEPSPGGASFVTACAQDDDMAKWPRFRLGL